MKKIVSILLLFIGFMGYSQTNGITYQAVIFNPSGEQLPGVNNANAPLANKNICLRFTIIDHNSQPEYIESIQTTTDEFGMVNLIIGTGLQLGGYATSFSNILWNANPKNLKVDLSATGVCAYYTEISNQPFTSVPFALYAVNSESTAAIAALQATVAANATATTAALATKENTANKSTTTTLGTSNVLFPTQNAVKTYVDTNISTVNASTTALQATVAANAAATTTALGLKEDAANKSTTTTLGTSNVLFPTQNAVKTYVDTNISTVNASTTALQATVAANAAATTTALATKEDATNKSTTTTLGTSNVLFPTQNAVKTYVDTNITSVNASNTAAITTLGNTVTSNAAATTTALGLKEDAANKSTTTTLGTSNVLFPTQNAVKTYVDTNITTVNASNTAAITTLGNTVTANAAATTTALGLKEDAANKSTTTTLGTSNVLFPTQNAVKTYVDTNITTVNASNTAAITTLGNTVTSNAAAATTALGLKEDAANKSTTTTLGTSNVLFPTQNAVKTYVDTNISTVNASTTALQATVAANAAATTTALGLKEDAANKSSDITLSDATNSKFPSELAVKTYVNNQVRNGTATNVSGVVAIANGGTGATTITGIVKGNGTSPMTAAVAGTDYIAPDNIIPQYRVTVGSNAGINTTGGYSVSIGRNANKLWNGSYNTAVGSFALETITSGSYNQAFGDFALQNRTSGSYGTAIGAFALQNVTTGSFNTSLGTFAGDLLSTGRQNTLLGHGSDPSANNSINQTVIGYDAVGAGDNTVQLGNTSVTNVNTSGTYTGSGFKTPTGNSSQYLKADGSIDSTTYLTAAGTATNVSGVVAIANGGTGASTAVAALTNLGAAPINSPTFTGVPLAPTPINTTNTTQIATTAFIQDLLLNAPAASSSALNGAIWTSDTTGTLGGVGFTISSARSQTPSNWDLSTSDFSAAPLSASQNIGGLSHGDDWVVTFASPITNLKLYCRYWRVANYVFDQPFTLLSGSGLTRTNSTTLTVSGWGNGIIQFAGPVTSLTVNSSADLINDASGQLITFASGGSAGASASGTGQVIRIDSPNLTGTPTAPTATPGTNTTQLATTAFVTNAVTTATSGAFVDLTTNQTVTGSKVFSSDIFVNGLRIGKGGGNQSTVIGDSANATQANNTALGFMTLDGNSGTDNTAVGTNSMRNSGATSQTTAIGENAGTGVNTGNNNTYLGFNANVTSNSSISNATAIGSGATVTSSNTIQLGADGTNGTTAVTNVNTSGSITANASISSEITANLTINNANAEQYKAKVLICNPSSQITITFNNDLPVGFNCMVLQKSIDANKINLAGGSGVTLKNRNNYTATAGNYAIATIVNIGGGIIVTAGDMQ